MEIFLLFKYNKNMENFEEKNRETINLKRTA